MYNKIRSNEMSPNFMKLMKYHEIYQGGAFAPPQAD